jgi:SAM-dependent methyltransferase
MSARSDLDVDALVEELRGEARTVRGRLAASTAPGTEDADSAMPGAAGRRPEGRVAAIDRLFDLTDPANADLRSHRGALGRVVLEIKGLLVRLLTPVLARQGSFNRTAVDAVREVERSAGAQIAALSRQILDLETRLDLLGAPNAENADAFDDGAFEDAFRGDGERVGHAQSRYLAYFPGPDSGPVLDLGFGRGEFLRLLRAAGIAASGVERRPELVERARVDGLDVRLGDLLAALEAVPDRSLGGLVAFQVVEHLPFGQTTRLVRLARRKLRPSGCLILESVNVQSLVTWARAWSIDPTHRQPVHPLTLRFLVEREGFGQVDIVYSGTVEPGERLEEGEGREARNASRVNALLFGPQDYAVVGRA